MLRRCYHRAEQLSITRVLYRIPIRPLSSSFYVSSLSPSRHTRRVSPLHSLANSTAADYGVTSAVMMIGEPPPPPQHGHKLGFRAICCARNSRGLITGAFSSSGPLFTPLADCCTAATLTCVLYYTDVYIISPM